MSTGTAPVEPPASGASQYSLYVLALAVCLTGNLAIRIGARGGWLPSWGQILLAVLATAPLVASAVLFWRLLRQDLDELLQRIVVEGLAFALVLYVPLAALYVNLHTAGVWTPRLDPPDIIMAPALLAAAGIELARRRYL